MPGAFGIPSAAEILGPELGAAFSALGPASSIYSLTQGGATPGGVIGLGSGLSALGGQLAGMAGATGLSSALSAASGPLAILAIVAQLIYHLAEGSPPNQSEVASSLLSQMISPTFQQAGVTGRQGGGHVVPKVGKWNSGGYFGQQPWGGAILPAAMAINAPFEKANVPGMNVARAGSILGNNLTNAGVTPDQQQQILRSLTGNNLQEALAGLVRNYATGNMNEGERVFNRRFAQDFPDLYGALQATGRLGAGPGGPVLPQTIADELFRTSAGGLLSLYGVPAASQGDLLTQLLTQAQGLGNPYRPGGVNIPTGFDPLEFQRRVTAAGDIEDPRTGRFRQPDQQAIALQYIQELQNAMTPPELTGLKTRVRPATTAVSFV